MLRKTLTAFLAVLLLAVVATASATAAAAAASSGPSRMTLCHNPPGNPDGPRTLQVPRSAWNGHRNHGDHQGACTSADRPRPAPGPDPPVPATPLSLSAKGDGDVDGDALFRVVVKNPGHDAPLDVALDGTLTGEGRWSVEGAPSGACAIDSRQDLSCAFGDLPAGKDLSFRLRFDGQVTVCRDVTATLALFAGNDATAGDDRVRESVHVGACAVTDRGGAAVASTPL
jgi:opacity protein-like surface antigen